MTTGGCAGSPTKAGSVPAGSPTKAGSVPAGSPTKAGSVRRGTVAVVVVRSAAAVLHLGFALPLVAVLGPVEAGRTLAIIGAIELASLTGRLGLPTELARSRRLGPSDQGVPSGPVLMAVAASALVGSVVGLVTDLPAAPLAFGAAAVTATQSIGGWQRGAQRFVMASLAHPVPALAAAIAGLALGSGQPVSWYLVGAATAAGAQVAVVARTIDRPDRPARSVARLLATVPLSAAGLANQALLLVLPVALVQQGHPETATVLTIALGFYRPLSILQFGLNFTVGPAVAGHPGQALLPRQRAVLDRAAGLQQAALVPYAITAGPVVTLVGAGLVTGHRLPDLLATWAVLLAGHVVAFGTGPSGQLLMMRGQKRALVAAAAAGAGTAVAWYAITAATSRPPWLQVAGTVSLALAVQNGVTAYQAWTHGRWLARPRTVLPSVVAVMAGLVPGPDRPVPQVERGGQWPPLP